MLGFHDIVKETTPRLVVEYKDHGDGNETMSWGVVGEVPHTLAISSVIRAQSIICNLTRLEGYRDIYDCPEPKLVMAWPSLDPSLKEEIRVATKTHPTLFFLDRKLNWDQLITMLEVIKGTLMMRMLTAQAVRKQQEQRGTVAQHSENDLRMYNRMNKPNKN